LGGKLFEVILASMAVLIAPVLLAMNGFYSMNSFDHLFWIGVVYIMMLVTDKPRLGLWVLLGVALGLGLMNKISVLWLGAGIFMGLVLTPNRKLLLTKGPYLSAAIAFLIFLPYIIWQQYYGWPLIEFIENASANKYVENSLPSFVLDVTMTMHPLNLLLWLSGLVYFVFNREGKKYRFISIIFITTFVILAAN